MNFSSADKVLETIQACDDVEWVRSENRVKINNAFNGGPYLDPEEAKKIGLKINCNFGEAPVLGQHGRRQYNTAFLSRSNYFTIRLPDAPTEKAMDWGVFITRQVNKILKRSRPYFELQRARWATTLLHGYAPSIWYDRTCILPKFVALEDFRVPTDALCDLSNVCWFGVRKYYTVSELSKKAFGKNASKGWNKKSIAYILEGIKEANTEKNDVKWSDQPEKRAELIKQNGGYYASDAVPTIALWHFYFQDDDCKWRLRVVPDNHTVNSNAIEFLYDDGKTSYGDDINQILHIQFGDLSSTMPATIHAVRSMGFLLMEPIFHSNLLYCRFLQHVHEHMNVWLRTQDVQGRQRALKVDLYDKAILPDGVSIVQQGERHNINPQLVEMAKGLVNELKQQASVSYTQDTEPGSNAEETATKTVARVSTVNAMMSGLLLTAKTYEQFNNDEICRRLCLRRSPNPDAQRFQKACRGKNIGSVYVNVDLWETEQDMPMGDGNPVMEQSKASELMKARPMFDPTAQQEILHEWTTTITGDAKKAERWVPVNRQRGVTDGQEHAELAFSTLMLGVPVRQREGLPLIDQISTLIGLMAGVVARIEKTGNMATQAEILGLQNSAQYTSQLIQQLAQDREQKAVVKQFSDALGKLMNTVKAFAQRLAQQQQSMAQNGNGNGSETVAKIQGKLAESATNSKIKQAAAAQKMHHKEIEFAGKEKRKDAETFAQIQRENVKTANEVQRKRAMTFNQSNDNE